MISTISHMLLLVWPLLFVSDLIHMAIANANLYINDDKNAWSYESWKFCEWFYDTLGESITFIYICMTIIMLIGTCIALAGGYNAHVTAHGADFTNCGYWWFSTIGYTLYVGGSAVFVLFRSTLYHLRSVKRYQKLLSGDK